LGKVVFLTWGNA
jgi:hypothetical protein